MRGWRSVEAHKNWGWVGATGGGGVCPNVFDWKKVKVKVVKAAEQEEDEEDEEDEEGEYDVEAILDIRGSAKEREVKVKWFGFSEEHDTWEPMEMIQESAGEILAAFLSSVTTSSSSNTSKKEAPKKKEVKSNANASTKKRSISKEDTSTVVATVNKKQKVKDHEEGKNKSTKVDPKVAVGDLVWAKSRGYIWWPGKVESLRGTKVEVEYFGPDGSFDIVALGAVRELSHPDYDSMVAKGEAAPASSDFRSATAQANAEASAGLTFACM